MLSIKNLSIKLSLGVCAATFAASLSSCLDDNTNYVLHPENFQVETNLIMDIVDSEAQYPEDIIVSRDDDRTPAKLPVIPEGFEVHYVVTIVNSENRAVGAYVVDEPQLNVKLVPGDYTVHAWADFVPVGDRSSRDHWYFTDDISEYGRKNDEYKIGSVVMRM